MGEIGLHAIRGIRKHRDFTQVSQGIKGNNTQVLEPRAGNWELRTEMEAHVAYRLMPLKPYHKTINDSNMIKKNTLYNITNVLWEAPREDDPDTRGPHTSVLLWV